MTNRPGKRERQARRRQRRATVGLAGGSRTLKVGRKHLGRLIRRDFAVADAETPGESVP